MIVLFIVSMWVAVVCWKSQRGRYAAFGLAPNLTCKHRTTENGRNPNLVLAGYKYSCRNYANAEVKGKNLVAQS
jgi:hypothetical protein